VAKTKYAGQFGREIRKRRIALSLTQEQLAGAARLHPTHISLIEAGERRVRIETIARLARALKTQPGELMPKIELTGK
jgi:transcriptional regulator with XRE-family HTH domain